MRVILAVFMLGHAVAHLPGFLVDLRLRTLPELPFRTTILNGSVDVGDSGIKVVGLAWLTVAIALGGAAIATLIRVPSWRPYAYLTLVLSTVLCVLGWPDARLGLLANVLIILAIFFGTRAHWL